MRFAAAKNCDTAKAGLVGKLGVVRAWRRFRKEEDGSLLIFGLFCFLMMLLLTGVSLDLMRFEERRTTLQNTIDRASLAAADLQQSLDEKEVVKDYFRKAGLTPPADNQITVTHGTNNDSKRVQIAVSEKMPTWFMSMVGVKSLSTPANSTAEESIGQVEISLVLDVSGSMNSNSRLTNLKPAARSFVDQIFDSAEADKVSISIIPYSTQVSLSDDLISYFNVTNEQTTSNCIEFSDDEGDFDTTAVSFGNGGLDRKYQRNGHFDPFYKASPLYLTNCATEAHREIMPFSGDRTALKNFITNLSAGGNTSIDLGMKWGTALLDPSMQGVVDGMIAAGDRPSEFSERPYSFDDTDSLKILVLMTDGENTTEYKLRPQYATGSSLLVRNTSYSASSTSLDQYSLLNPSNGQYYVFALSQWRAQPWGAGTYDETTCTGSGKKKTCTTTTKNDAGYNGINPVDYRMSWPEVWAKMSIYYFSDNIIYGAYGSTTLRNQWRPASVSDPIATTYVGNSAKDTLTRKLCNEAKDPARGIRIYTIAFEAPSGGQQLLSDCADAGYYAVEGLDISEAFSGIVNSINKLRLTH